MSSRSAAALMSCLLALSACGGSGGGAGMADTATSAPVSVVAPSAAAPAATPVPTGATDVAAPTPVTTPVGETSAAAPTPVATPQTYRRVVYVGNDVPDLTAYEAWLGQAADGVQLHSGRASWSDWSSSIGWLIDRWSGVNRTIYWSIPLFAQGATLADASAGRYNDYYVAAAQRLAAGYPNATKIYVRTGWEFNGDWQPWAARGKEAEYRGAFRQFVASFRSVSDKFVFEWTPNVGDLGMNPEDAYPGDDVVDIIGMDFYYNHEWDPADPMAAWNWRVNETYGLAWHQTFAARHGKRTAYAEWGVSRDSDGPYVDAAARWFAAHDVVYAGYWNSNAAYPGKLSDNQYPAVSAPYQAMAKGD